MALEKTSWQRIRGMVGRACRRSLEGRGAAELAIGPEFFATGCDPLETVCAAPWTMMGLMIGNQLHGMEDGNESRQ